MEGVRIAETVYALVVMTHDARNLSVILDLGKNPFANRGMLLHLSPLVQGESSRLLKKACGQSHLSDVVHEPTQMHEILLSF